MSLRVVPLNDEGGKHRVGERKEKKKDKRESDSESEKEKERKEERLILQKRAQ